MDEIVKCIHIIKDVRDVIVQALCQNVSMKNVINDAKTMRSVAESNKETAKHIITSSIDEKNETR
jgi:hypothetical protein